jgi:hypothetical protein
MGLDTLTDNNSMVIDIVDLERHATFNMLKDFPDKETRVVGVICKCDRKEDKSSEWVRNFTS